MRGMGRGGWIGLALGIALAWACGLPAAAATGAGARGFSPPRANGGTVVVWGAYSYGVPAGLTDVVAVAAGQTLAIALKADGSIAALGPSGFVPADLRTPDTAHVVGIAAGGFQMLAIKADGTVVGWERGSYIPVPAELGTPETAHVVAVAAGWEHAVALRANGTVVAWGDDKYGQTDVPAGLTGVVAIAAGWYHTVALKADGTVFAWGDNSSGQTNVPVGLTDVVAIAASNSHTVALRADGTIAGWGSNAWGETTVPPNATGVIAVAAGWLFTVALKADGMVVAWGCYLDGQMDVPPGLTGVVAIAAGRTFVVALTARPEPPISWGDFSSPHHTDPPTGLTDVAAIAAGNWHAAALKTDGTVAAWGNDTYGQTDVPAGLTAVAAISAGEYHTVALKADGTVVAWGDNRDGETDVPAGLTGVAAIAAGNWHTVALKADGTVVAWGWDYYGQADVPPALQNSATAHVVAIAAGDYHTVALKADGTVVAWGDNGDGETDVPAGLTGVTAIAAANWHTMALKSDGTVVAWGWNSAGETDVPPTLQDPATARVVAVAAGQANSVALKSDGTVVAWGWDYGGPATPPAGLRQVAAIAGGGFQTLALAGIGIFPASLGPGTVGEPYLAVTFTQFGGSSPITWGESGSLPAGMQFTDNGDGTATLSGTPTEVGTFPFTGTATDALGGFGTASYTLDVVCPVLTLMPASPLSDATASLPYRQDFSVQGGGPSAAYTYGLTGTPPDGLNLAGNTLSGTPTETGTFTFSITGKDQYGCSSSREYTLTVVCPTIDILPASLPAAVKGQAYDQSLTPSAGVVPFTFTMISGFLPTGLTLSPGGVISGTPIVSGTFRIVVLVNDANGCDGFGTYTLAAYTDSFHDDRNASALCVDSKTGAFQWSVAGGLTYTGTLNVYNGGTMYWSQPGASQYVYLYYDPNGHMAWGYLYDYTTVLYSSLYDSNTLNDPPGCSAGQPPV